MIRQPYHRLTPTERRIKLYRILFKRWLRREGLAVALLLSVVWMWMLWIDLMKVG